MKSVRENALNGPEELKSRLQILEEQNTLFARLLQLCVRELYIATGGSPKSRDLHPSSALLERIDLALSNAGLNDDTKVN